MKSEEQLQYIYKRTAEHIIESPDNWARLLSFASRLYKYSFDEIVLIYAQQPEATMVASLPIWNRVGRYVNRGAKSIKVSHISGDRLETHHVFDVTQTHGKAKPYQWQCSIEDYPRLFQSLQRQYTISAESFDSGIAQAVQQSLRTHNTALANLTLATDSAVYLIRQRCGLPETTFASTPPMTDLLTFSHFGRNIIAASQDILRCIEREMKVIRKEQLYGIDLHREKRDQLSEYSNLEQSRGRPAVGSVRTDGAPIPERDAPGSGAGLSDNRYTHGQDASSGSGSGRETRRTDGSTVKTESHAPNGRHTGQSAAHEQHQSAGRGNRLERNRISDSVNQLSFTATEPLLSGSVFLGENQIEALICYHGAIPKDTVLTQDNLHSSIGSTLEMQEYNNSILYIFDKNAPLKESNINRPVNGKMVYGVFAFVGTDDLQQIRSLSQDEKNRLKKTFTNALSSVRPAHIAKYQNEEQVLRAVIKYPPAEHANNQIFHYFTTHNNLVDRKNFLQRTYGIGEIRFDGLEIDYNSKGMYVEYRVGVFHTQKHLSWDNVARRIDRLIQDGRYLDNQPELQAAQGQQMSFGNLAAVSPKPKTTELRADQPSSPDWVKATGDVVLQQDGDHVTITGADRVNDPDVRYVEFDVSLPDEKQEPVPQKGVGNYHASADLSYGGAKTKYQNNVEAIRLLKHLEKENLPATEEQQQILSKYVGWGGLPQVFDPHNASWEKEYTELKALLTDEEYKIARASTPNAHYTDPKVVRVIYETMERFGYRSGKILEPSMGVGNFFAVLPKAMQNSNLVGVELDDITGRLAQKLYPDADIHIKGFEKTSFANDSFDLVVGNVPFGSYSVADAAYNKYNLFIHDYFVVKALDKLRPGGMMAVVTSKGTMDKLDSTARQQFAARAELIGAVRLPNTAFQSIANTNVTTDVLFFQKTEHLPKEQPGWVHTDVLPGTTISVNQYYIDHPEMMLGEMQFSRNMYGNEKDTTLVPRENFDLYHDLQTATAKLQARYQPMPQKNISSPPLNKIAEQEPVPEVHLVKNYTYTVAGDQIYYRKNDTLSRMDFTGKKAERIKGIHQVRQVLRKVIDIQSQPYRADQLENALTSLNRVYDDFVTQYGYLNSKANRAAFRDDDDMPLLLSIEDQQGEKEEYIKAPVFRKATIRPYTAPEKADSAIEALMISMNTQLGVDLHYMSRLYGKDPDEIINELGNRIYLNPEKARRDNVYVGWELDEEYLSGNVKEKLTFAKLKALEQPENYKRNVEALTAVQPKPLNPGEIDFRIGSPWIPIDDYKAFLYTTFGTSAANQGNEGIDIYYNSYTSVWEISHKQLEKANLKVNQTYGTERANAYRIFEDSLNLKSTTIKDSVTYYDEDGKERVRYVINAKQTMIARAKQQQIKELFRSWLFRDAERADRLVKLYNDKFNNIRPRKYDGSHLVFKNMSQEYNLRAHQKDVAARILLGGTSTLMAHEVGAGKTAAMIAAGMSLKQSGTIHKPVFVVPNHLLEQWQKEFLRFYPMAHVLVATVHDFEKERRRQFFGKMTTGEYDAIIIGHSSFEKIPISAERQRRLLEKEIDNITTMIEETKSEKGENWSIKQMEIQRKRLEARYEKLSAVQKKDDILTFEQIGIDYMFVDEAHAYKNCFTFTKMRNVAGIGTSSSQRAMDMLLKCQYLQEINNGRGVVMATGTPISNSMSEMYVMQRYLQPDKLRELGVDMFDNWAATFGEVVTSLEITPEGNGFRTKSRFAKFFNLPELMSTFQLIADIQTADMLHLPVPAIEGGKPEIVVTECSEYQKEKLAEFAERADCIRNGSVDPSVDNMLKLTLEAKLLAIDPRLLNPNAPNVPYSKLNRCIDDVFQIWDATANKKLTQVIFSDVGVPNGSRTFNVYDEIKARLIEKGVPEKEIAFIHDAKTDAQREALFGQMRSGDIRVLLGSTQKLGTGTNMQDRLYVLHHLDCPYRPSDITQRNGRGLRQGNKNQSIKIKYFVTKGTFDSYLWQIQEQKLRYITQIMNGKSISRSCEDMDETVLSAAEVKALATSNPQVVRKMEVDNEVMRLRILKSNWENEHLSLERNIFKQYPVAIQSSEQAIRHIKEDMQSISRYVGKNFQITLGGHIYDKRVDAGNRILLYAKQLGKENGAQQKVGTFKGLELNMRRDAFDQVHLDLKGQHTYTAHMSDDSAGICVRLENLLDRLPKVLDEESGRVDSIKRQLEDAKIAIKQPFEEDDTLRALLAEQAKIDTELEFSKSKEESVLAEDQPEDEKENHLDAQKKPKTHSHLVDAVITNDEQAVQSVLSSEDTKNINVLVDGATPLHWAVENRAYKSAETLVQYGAYVDAINQDRKTPLCRAVERGDEDMARLLLEAGADPNLSDGKRTVHEIDAPQSVKTLLERYSAESESKEPTPSSPGLGRSI